MLLDEADKKWFRILGNSNTLLKGLLILFPAQQVVDFSNILFYFILFIYSLIYFSKVH